MGEHVIPSLSGQSVLDLMHAYRQLVGPDTVAHACERLSPEVRETFAIVNALSWVPIHELGELIDAIGAQAQLPADDLLDQAVRISIERTLSTVWRVLLRFTSDRALIDRTPILWSKSRNVGRLEAFRVRKGEAEVLLRDWHDPSDRHLRTLGVALVRVMELAGREHVRITRSRTRDGARYHLRWHQME